MNRSLHNRSWTSSCLLTLALACAVVPMSPLRAADPAPAGTPAKKPAEPGKEAVRGVMDRNHLLRPGDVVEITVDGYPQFSKTVRLYADGTFDYPILDSVQAEGLTTKELRERVTEGFRKELKRPIVYVNLSEIFVPPPPPVVEKKALKIFANGAVTRKGEIDLVEPRPLRQVLPLIGPSERADLTSIRVRYPDQTVRFIDASAFARTGTFKDDIEIKGGEEIILIEKPEAPRPEPVRVQVLGHVTKTGYMTFEGNPPLLEVLDKAGGARPGASLERVKIINGGAEQLVNIEKYMAGDVTANYFCKNGDVILLMEKPLKVLVFGEVQRPGEVAIDENKTLAQVILEAGITGGADRKKVELIRELPGGKVERKSINVTDIERQKKDDVKLLRGDVVFVPSRKQGGSGIMKFLGNVAAPLWLIRSIVPGAAL
ncbi:MAG: polysaccharide export protein, partial [Armatimonadetes bacterium]|nr:polysaccharide export protein [Armatimonadota bacterium]